MMNRTRREQFMPPSLTNEHDELGIHTQFAELYRTGDIDSLANRETYAEAVHGRAEAPLNAHMPAVLTRTSRNQEVLVNPC